eukprot:5594189-Amphidinium_carterae.1
MASLARKSTGTIKKRAADLKRYVAWCADNEKKAFPVMEEHVFDFLRSGSLAPTFGRSLLSALAFSGGVFGVDGALIAAQSARNVGKAYELFQAKGPLKQAAGLRVDELGALEKQVGEASGLDERVISGLFTFMALARARFSDTAYAEE